VTNMVSVNEGREKWTKSELSGVHYMYCEVASHILRTHAWYGRCCLPVRSVDDIN